MSGKAHGLTLKQILAHASDFDFYPKNSVSNDDERKHFRITVSRVNRNKFNVYFGAQVWNGVNWAWFQQWSSVDRLINLKKHAYTLDEAIAIALEQVEKVKVNGFTYDEWQQSFADIEASRQGKGI